MDQVNLWKAAFKKPEVIWYAKVHMSISTDNKVSDMKIIIKLLMNCGNPHKSTMAYCENPAFISQS